MSEGIVIFICGGVLICIIYVSLRICMCLDIAISDFGDVCVCQGVLIYVCTGVLMYVCMYVCM